MNENDRVKEIRSTLGLTLEKFGARIGITRSAVSNIEKGNRNLTEQTIKSICREFNVNEVWLRTGEGGIENMFTKVSPDDEYSLSLGKLTLEENQFVKNAVNYLANAEPEKLKIIEEFMKKCLGIPQVQEDTPKPEVSLAEAESAYIKSRLDSARTEASFASNITEGDENSNKKMA